MFYPLRWAAGLANSLVAGLMTAADKVKLDGITAGAGVSYRPGRTLFVAKSWPVGVDATVYFTTVSAALAQAASMTPLSTDPIAVVVYPGTYSESLTFVSNVNLLGLLDQTVFISGTHVWNAGAGVNAGQAATFEVVALANISLSTTLAVNTTAKSSSSAQLIANCSSVRALTFTGRTTSDFVQLYNHSAGPGAWSISTCSVLISESTMNGSSFSMTTCPGAVFRDVQCTKNLTLVGTALTMLGGSQSGSVAVDATSTLAMPGGQLTGVCTVASGGLVDLIGTSWSDSTKIAGAGATDRSPVRLTKASTSVGANAIAISPPLLDANYHVAVTQTAGAAALVTVTAKTASGFTLNDAVGGNSFDLTVLKE